MDDVQNLSHTQWSCKYPVGFIPNVTERGSETS